MTSPALGSARQLAIALVEAPASLARMSARSWGWLALYVALCGTLLIGVAALAAAHEDTLERALLGFLFPESWHAIVDFLLAFVLEGQAQQVVVNVLLFVTLNLVSLAFFWVKESLSQSYERDLALRRAEDDPRPAWREYPIWFQALEEVKWTLVGFALMFVVLWLGHSPEPWRDTAATILSYLVLFFTAAGNFLAPPMQRRRLQYSQIIKAILSRPLLAFGFGAAISLPQVAVLHLVSGSTLPAFFALVVIFAVNVLFIAWSAVAGTHAGLALMPTAAAMGRSRPWTIALAWTAILAILASGGYIATRVGLLLADKSQILKCRYAVDWSTLRFEQPDLGGLLRAEVSVAVAFEVTIDNPTGLPVRLEDNRLVVSDGDVVIATSRLTPLEVPAHGITRTRVGLDAKVRAASILEGASLDPRAWDLTLYVALDGSLELPVYLK